MKIDDLGMAPSSVIFASIFLPTAYQLTGITSLSCTHMRTELVLGEHMHGHVYVSAVCVSI